MRHAVLAALLVIGFAAPALAQGPLAKADGCFSRREFACVVAILEDAGQTEVELMLLARAYRALNDERWIRVAHLIIDRFPRSPFARQVQGWIHYEDERRRRHEAGGDPGMTL